MRRRRDPDLDAPPSSRRGRVGYRFATVAALVRTERMPLVHAERLVDEWERYVASQLRSGETPAVTAENIARFEKQRLQKPYRAAKRDPKVKKGKRMSYFTEDVQTRTRRQAASMGEARDNAKAESLATGHPIAIVAVDRNDGMHHPQGAYYGRAWRGGAHHYPR